MAFELNVAISLLRAGSLTNSLQDAQRLHRFPVLTQMLNYIPSKSYEICCLMEGFCVTLAIMCLLINHLNLAECQETILFGAIILTRVDLLRRP